MENKDSSRKKIENPRLRLQIGQRPPNQRDENVGIMFNITENGWNIIEIVEEVDYTSVPK